MLIKLSTQSRSCPLQTMLYNTTWLTRRFRTVNQSKYIGYWVRCVLVNIGEVSPDEPKRPFGLKPWRSVADRSSESTCINRRICWGNKSGTPHKPRFKRWIQLCHYLWRALVELVIHSNWKLLHRLRMFYRKIGVPLHIELLKKRFNFLWILRWHWCYRSQGLRQRASQ